MASPIPRPPVAIIFDFDGVILDSTPLKSQAYLDLYAGEDPAKLAEVSRHERQHGGVTRRIKLAHYEKELFGRSGDTESVESLAQRYADLVLDAVMACRFVPGARELLETARGRIDMHLVSGTPLVELSDVVEKRGLSPYFQTVQGAPVLKPEAFANIMRENRYDPARTLAIGDALTEFRVAQNLGIAFLGIEPPGEKLFPDDIVVLPSLEGADRLIGLS